MGGGDLVRSISGSSGGVMTVALNFNPYLGLDVEHEKKLASPDLRQH